MVAVGVLRRVVDGGAAVDGARDQHGDLELEGDPRLEDAEDATNLGPRGGEVGLGGRQLDLALAVITEIRGLEDAREADRLHGGLQFGEGGDDRERGAGDAGSAQEFLLAATVLADREHVGRRMARHVPGDKLDGRGRDILELEGDATAALGEARERGGVAPIGRHMLIGERGGAGSGGGIEGADLVAEAAGGDRRHAAELAAAEDPDGSAGLQGALHDQRCLPLRPGIGLSSTALVCFAR